MSPMDGKHRWMLAVKIAILFHGIFLKNSICESSAANEMCRQKNVLFVSAHLQENEYLFPKKAVYRDINGTELCFSVYRSKTDADCCQSFNCSFNVTVHQNNNKYLFLNEGTLSKQDIVMMKEPRQEFKCMPSKLYNKKTGFLLNIHDCLNKDIKDIRLSQNNLCKRESCVENVCEGLAETDYNLVIAFHMEYCVSCKPRENSCTPTFESSNGTITSLENAVKIMNNLSSLLGDLDTKPISVCDIKGVVFKLPLKDQTDINIGMTSGDISILGENALWTGSLQWVQIPREASAMAVKRNSSIAGVVLFPGIHPDDPNSSFVENGVVGIEMGAEISSLSHTIDIHFKNVDKNGKTASCVSWDGKGKKPNWIADGCQTTETRDNITCQCSHLTFFAILLSPPRGNISASDFRSLTYITSIGCGLSLFFLAVGLFMHCVIRKRKASQGTTILMNLFVAMLNLNLSFLVNENIAKLGNFGACVVVAAVMHYTMLATFTWFFIEALHLYFNLRKLTTEIQHYMTKICATGWVTPAVVVIGLLASGKYDYIVIHTDDGISAQMCWISDAVVHQAVNIGYYAIVFIFTFSIFILTVRQIVILKPAEEKARDVSSIKTNTFSILGLLLLLGITWAFAFFSYGPLLIASYYIFTILNSFQGFFLFIFYYNSSKVVREGRSSTSSSTLTSSTVAVSPYQ